MGNAAELRRMTADEFLEWDRTQTVRHEFVGGEVYAMSGAGIAHNMLTLNLAMALRAHLAGSACRTLAVDVKLKVEAVGNFYYPDLIVTCSPADLRDAHIVREPTLLVEVLSPSTAAHDRGDKFTAYRLLATLKEYLLVDLEGRRCDLYRKNAEGLWVLHPTEPEAGVTLASVSLEVSAAALWAEVPHVERTPPPPERWSA